MTHRANIVGVDTVTVCGGKMQYVSAWAGLYSVELRSSRHPVGNEFRLAPSLSLTTRWGPTRFERGRGR